MTALPPPPGPGSTGPGSTGPAPPTSAPPTSAGTAVIDLSEPNRQSLWAVVLLGLRTLRQMGLFQLTLLVGFIVARIPSVLTLVGLAILLSLVLFVIATAQWWRYTFVVVGDELIVKRGLLEQETLTVPLARVQSVSLEQKLLHRIVSVVQVELDTAGTQTAEFVIDAVDHPVAEELQRMVSNYRSLPIESDSRPPVTEKVLLRHDQRRLLRIALAQSPLAGLIVAWPLLAFMDEIGSVVDWLPFGLPDIEEPEPGLWLIWVLPLLLLAGVVVSILLNIVRTFLSDWNLTLTQTDAGLRREAGLLSTTSVSATVPRIQVVRVRQGLLQRWAGLRSLDLDIIGTGNIRLPGCDRSEVQLVRSLVLPEVGDHPMLNQRVSSEEIFKNTRNAAVAAFVLVLGLIWSPIGYWALVLFVAVPLVWLSTRRSVRLRRWGMTPEAVAKYDRFVGSSRDEMLLRKINGITVRQSLFERKRDLATLVFASAAGRVTVGMIPVELARSVRDRALYQVETDHRSWM